MPTRDACTMLASLKKDHADTMPRSRVGMPGETVGKAIGLAHPYGYIYLLDQGICPGSSPAFAPTIWYRLIQSWANA